MTEEEMARIVESWLEARLAARLAADRERVRQEVIMQLRREIDREHYDKINRRHPIQGPGDPKVEAERRRVMAERARADNEAMDKANSRPVEGTLAHARRRADAAGGGMGFKIR
jgi:hypothetical protein